MSKEQAPASGESAAGSAWRPSALLIGVLSGAGAALGWAAGLAAALHGVEIGLSPADLTLHRFAWLGPVLAIFVFRYGLGNPGGIGWGRGIALTVFAGPPLALFSYYGFLTVPLGHGAVIQPSSAALGGLLLTALFLSEPLARTRIIGAAAIVLGLIIYGGETVTTIGSGAILGDLSFVAAGLCWATFGLLLALWRIEPLRAATVVTVFSLVYVPFHAWMFGYERILAAGLLGEPVAGGRSEPVCRRGRNFPVHARGGAARAGESGGVSRPRPRLHHGNRLSLPRRRADARATCGFCRRHDRICARPQAVKPLRLQGRHISRPCPETAISRS
jgi:drug/metabolite transporter (DMT)-like permease